jgi:hypothetical protein
VKVIKMAEMFDGVPVGAALVMICLFIAVIGLVCVALWQMDELQAHRYGYDSIAGHLTEGQRHTYRNAWRDYCAGRGVADERCGL